MLAYELAHINKKTNTASGDGIPIKKIFVDKDKITIDATSIDENALFNTPDKLKNYLQRAFDMTIDTNKKINLPHKKVASNSQKPYVKISGYINLRKKQAGVVSGLLENNQ